MKGSLAILAVLCVIVAAEASSVRFVTVDEAQNSNGKDKDRNGVSEGTDSDVRKSIDDVVKKISDGGIQSEKTVKNLEADRSSAAEETVKESVKKAASSEKSKIEKRDVRKALDFLAKRAMKRGSEEIGDSGWNIFNARKIVIKYLSLQKTVVGKVTTSLIYAVEHLESNQGEKEILLGVMKSFKTEMEQAYDHAIQALVRQTDSLREALPSVRKHMRADEIPGIMTTLNQRNPMMIIPLVTRLINAVAGAASVADLASSFNTRSSAPDAASLLEVIEKLLSNPSLLPIALDPDMSEF